MSKTSHALSRPLRAHLPEFAPSPPLLALGSPLSFPPRTAPPPLNLADKVAEAEGLGVAGKHAEGKLAEGMLADGMLAEGKLKAKVS